MKKHAADLLAEHRLRVDLAEPLLPQRPLQDYGVERLIQEAKMSTAVGLDPSILEFLPPVRTHFGNVADARL